MRFLFLFGLLYCCWIPPFQSPDEYNHFFRAWQISEGCFLPEKTADMRLGGYIPASLDSLKRRFAPLRLHPEQRISPSQVFPFLYQALEPERRIFADFPNTAIYAPAAYAPQALSMALLRPLGASPLLLLYATRLANLLCWYLLVCAAWKHAPFVRNSLLALAVLPATLVMAASANPDVLVNGLCFWLFAALLLSRIDATTWVAALAVAVNKIIYVPLLGLSTLGPDWSKRSFRLRVVGLVAAAALAAWWGSRQASMYFISYDNYHPAYRKEVTLNEGVDPQAQVQHIMAQPLEFAGVALRSWVRALPSMTAHITGKFGWEKNYLPAWGIALLCLALAAVVLTDRHPLRWQQRLFAAALAALVFGLFAVVMYALWCPVGGDSIDNWQGRYFLPLMPLIVLAAGGWIAVGKKEQVLHRLVLLIFGGAHVLMLAAIVERYWS